MSGISPDFLRATTDEPCCAGLPRPICLGCAGTPPITVNVLGRLLCGACWSLYCLRVEDAKREVLRRLLLGGP